MQDGTIVRTGTGCPCTNDDKHHVEDDCRQCGGPAGLAELVAIVEKLPKTGDDVPITISMNLFSDGVDYDFGCCAIDDDGILCRDVRGIEFRMSPEDCYSTREAAETPGGE